MITYKNELSKKNMENRQYDCMLADDLNILDNSHIVSMHLKANYEKAVKCYKKGTDAGNFEAMQNLGWCYVKGIGIKKNIRLGVRLIRTAAQNGDYAALYRLGLLYKDIGPASKSFIPLPNEGVKKNSQKAVKYFKLVIESCPNKIIKGRALYRLGLCYIDGNGIEKNIKKGLELCEQGAEMQGVDGILQLAMLYESGTTDTNEIVDYSNSFKCYKKAAELGDDEAIYMLGHYYRYSLGVDKDYNKAMEYFQTAAEKGNEYAMFNIGDLYYYGCGVEMNYNEAIKWYKYAAEAGHELSCNKLGSIYRDGVGVDKDIEEARRWFQKSIDIGNVGAKIDAKWYLKNL